MRHLYLFGTCILMLLVASVAPSRAEGDQAITGIRIESKEFYGFRHLYIVLKSDGDWERVIRGGPDIRLEGMGDIIGGVSKLLGVDKPDFIVVSGQDLGSSKDKHDGAERFPRYLYCGDGAEHIWEIMKIHSSTVTLSNLKYWFGGFNLQERGLNSNIFVEFVLYETYKSLNIEGKPNLWRLDEIYPDLGFRIRHIGLGKADRVYADLIPEVCKDCIEAIIEESKNKLKGKSFTCP